MLAVLEFHNYARISEYEATAITDLVRMAASDVLQREFLIMTRESIMQLLPPGKRLEQCEGECEVETGRNVGADFVIAGEIGRFGKNLQVKMKLYHTKTSEYLGGKVATAPTIDDLARPLSDEAARLFDKLIAGGR